MPRRPRRSQRPSVRRARPANTRPASATTSARCAPAATSTTKRARPNANPADRAHSPISPESHNVSPVPPVNMATKPEPLNASTAPSARSRPQLAYHTSTNARAVPWANSPIKQGSLIAIRALLERILTTQSHYLPGLSAWAFSNITEALECKMPSQPYTNHTPRSSSTAPSACIQTPLESVDAWIANPAYSNSTGSIAYHAIPADSPTSPPRPCQNCPVANSFCLRPLRVP